ncbi:MAG: diacylglycerol kinase family lipid kinase [candidate division WOR-3 bacterium]|nr:diacylglycerol kinase family lipid kinase [candidate division WOR-3 bacterium]
MPRVVAVVNPVAGKARGARLRAQAAAELMRLFPDMTFVESNAPGHASVLAQGARDAELIIAIGGDGTVREVVSGLMSATGPLDSLTPRPFPLLAVVPVGSCNDLSRNVGIPADVIEACRAAREGKARPIDVIRVEMSDEATSRQTYFINAAGFGFDAAVTAEAHKSKHLRGLPLYLVAIIRTLRNLECPLVRIRAGAFEAEQRVLMIAAANGRYYGGGMKVAPEAKPDDGLIEVCIADSMGRLSALRKLPRFVAGTHVTLKEVRMLHTPELELEFLEPVQVEFDGDLLVPQPFSRFRLTALPKAINLRVP